MIIADAFNMPLKDQSVDMIITSPPFFYNLSSMVRDRNKNYICKKFGLEYTEAEYRTKVRLALVEMHRVCKGTIWVHTSRPDLWLNEDPVTMKPWFYTQSRVPTFWLGWRDDMKLFKGWKEEPAYKDGHWGVFPDDMIVKLIQSSTYRPGVTVLDPFAGTGVVGNVANRMGYTGINMDLDGS